MKYLLCSLVVLALVGCATDYGITPPPALLGQTLPITIAEYPADQIDQLCRFYGGTAEGVIEACSLRTGDGCLIVLPDQGRRAVYLLRHEIQHCAEDDPWANEDIS